jgi:hypothetical protein
VTVIHSPAALAVRRRSPATAAGGPSCTAPSTPLHLRLARKVEGLPKDVGVILLGLGALGIAIPGPIPSGASFVLLGVLFLRPGLIVRFAGPLAGRFPRLFGFLIDFVDHLRIDLERRYPGSAGC